MDFNLGAVPLSADVLKQSNIGLWAFELDEGSEPRMYVDNAMLKLLGLKKQLSPEKTYHAWYDHIDSLHYAEVQTAVEKMANGIHSEVQYPWHTPDGKIMIVRCGGVRNYNYKTGIRIEGVHRDVTSLVHFEKEKDEELQRKSDLLKHEKLRSDSLRFLAENEPEPKEFINFFADRLLQLSGCDHVIYRGIDGTKIQKKLPGIKYVSENICAKCPYSNPLNEVYKSEVIEIQDVHCAGSKVPGECQVKSSFNYVVKFNGQIQGLLSLNYLKNNHTITNAGSETMKMFAQMLSVALGNIEARKEKQKVQEERIINANNIIETFCKKFTTVYSVNTKNDSYKVLKNNNQIHKYSTQGKSFSTALKKYVQNEVFSIDKKIILSKINYQLIEKELNTKGHYSIKFRALINDYPVWHKITITKIVSSDEVLVGIIEQDAEILLSQVEETIKDDYFGIYVVDLNLDIVRAVRNSRYYPREVNAECYSKAFMEFTVGLEEDAVEYFSKLCNPHYLQQALLRENKHEYVYYSYRTKMWTKLSTFVLTRDDNNVPLTIAHCFSNVDSLQKQNHELSLDLKKQIEENKEHAVQLEEALAFTNFFLDTYNAAFYVNLNTRTSKVYKKSVEANNDTVYTDYYKTLCDHAKKAASPSERELLKEYFSPEFLSSVLRKEREFKYTFTDLAYDKPRRILFHVIRGVDPIHAAIGFRDITAEVEIEEKYTNTVMGLSDNFQAIYDANVNTGKYILYSENNDFANNVSDNLDKGDDIFENMLKDINTVVYKDDRYLFKENFTREKIKKLIKNNSEISYEYRLLINGVPQWYKLKIVKSNQQKNHFLVGIFNVNKERAKEKELSQVLGGLTSEFSSLFHVDVTTGVFKNYMQSKNSIQKTMDQSNGQYETLLQKLTDIYVHPEDKEKVLHYSELKYLKKLLANKKAEHTFFRRLCGKEYRWFEQVIVKVQDIDEPLEEFIVYFTDRDKEVREDQENKRQLQEALGMAQSANRAKTTFLNNMSHDIRTPMNAIIGYAGLAASHIDNKNQVQDYLSKIGQSSDHLLSLINDVLDMSRIESGKMNIEEKNENLSDIIHTLRDIIQSDVNSKQLDFYIDSCDVNDEYIVCDKLRLNQVLLNILSNAVKYTSPGGNVSMRIRQTTVRNNGYAAYEFRIKDNGIGMTKEFLKTIFDPFTRMKSSTVSGIQGTGLGMAITKNIVDMMGGTIEIQSELNKGTEVILNFDFRLQKTPKKPVKIAELEGLKGLVVDDDTNTCASITSMLKDIGMKGEWCTSGKEAIFRAGLAYKDGEPFKVYIIDWLMPDMNGIETARRIRKSVGNDVPIIILTAYDWSDVEEEAKDAGISGFVSKPMFPSDLHRVLNECLGKDVTSSKKIVQKESKKLEGRKILLVDDNEYNREIAVEILEDYKVIVTTANDGVEAVEKIKNAKTGDFDLILMDIQMPILNGYDATKQIRALGTEVSKIPILAMTANAFEEDRKLALAAGMNEHIPKPIDFAKLESIIERFLK